MTTLKTILICPLCGSAVVEPLKHARTGKWHIKCYLCNFEVQHKFEAKAVLAWKEKGKNLVSKLVKEADIHLSILKSRLEKFEEV